MFEFREKMRIDYGCEHCINYVVEFCEKMRIFIYCVGGDSQQLIRLVSKTVGRVLEYGSHCGGHPTSS